MADAIYSGKGSPSFAPVVGSFDLADNSADHNEILGFVPSLVIIWRNNTGGSSHNFYMWHYGMGADECSSVTTDFTFAGAGRISAYTGGGNDFGAEPTESCGFTLDTNAQTATASTYYYIAFP